MSLLIVASCDSGSAEDVGTGGDSTSGADTTGSDVSDDTGQTKNEDTSGIDTRPQSGDSGSDTSADPRDVGRDGRDDVSDVGRDGETDATDGGSTPIRLLIFTKTEGYRHDSIEAGVDTVSGLADERGWEVEHTEEASRFTDDSLSSIDVVVWLNTTGDVLDSSQQTAFEQWLESGGGYVGVHAAADTEYDWDWYGSSVMGGAWFDSHPSVQTATIDVEDDSHPATNHLDETWMHEDEWYNFQENPRGEVEVLMAVDESSYNGGEMGDDHPIAWYHQVSGGRAFYTGLGHTSEAFRNSDFIAHLAGGIRWTANP